MIIKKLLELCLSLLTSLLSNDGSIPALPDQILTIFQTVINYMLSGIDLLGMFIGPTALTFVGVCLDVIIALNLFYFGCLRDIRMEEIARWSRERASDRSGLLACNGIRLCG